MHLAKARHRHRNAEWVTAVAVLALALAASCTPPPAAPPPTTVVDDIPYRVMGGVEQVYVVGATAGDHIVLTHGSAAAGSGEADRLGSLVFRGLTQGATYTVSNTTTGVDTDVRVLVADVHPDAAFYRSTSMGEGLNYIPMRDGVTIAATVRPPLGLSIADGPFPTVIEYSGYPIAGPNEPFVSKIGTLFGLPPDPLAPGGETDVGSLLMRLAGFAVVSVQLRGSGCSGGEADLFDLPSQLDGYDVVETVAAQPWVAHGAVGMVGISFSGFSQLATASTRPPHLAAIAPLSFVGSLYDLAHPGGIFNSGFARTWMAERVEQAHPAPEPGAQRYATELVRTDAECRYNQLLRLQTLDGNLLIRSESTFGPLYQRRDFRRFMERVEVPTFASLQFDDEETSSYAMLSAPRLLAANDKVFLNVSNGHHRDAVSPDTVTQLFEFLDIYVARRTPEIKFLVDLFGSVIFGNGSAPPPLPARFIGSLDEARAEFEARPRVRVLLELASGQNEGSNPGARWQFASPTYPVAGSVERTWYLGSDGTLRNSPGAGGNVTYRPDPGARPATLVNEVSSGLDWTPVPGGNGAGFITPPLDRDMVALGPAAASIRISSTAADTDLGLVLSEVRPDGREMLVSTGVQRASMRSVDPTASTPVQPAFTYAGSAPLDAGVTEVPVQILPLGHVFRAGSRLRLSVASPGDRERWAFESIDPVGGTTTDTIHYGGAQPSSITLTVVPKRGFPEALLPCPSAGKPCRIYTPATNGG